jgi:hypothetical protein
MRKLLFMGALLGLLTAPVLADWNVGDPYKMHFPQLPDLNGWDVNATYPKVLADDWQCLGSGPVSDIHFWGSWKQDLIGTITSFHVSIHADVPAQPGIPSHPGPVLWEEEITNFAIRSYDPTSNEGWYDPNTGQYAKPDHQHYFQYNLTNILNPYPQAQGMIYWLDISARVLETDKKWGWKTSLDHWNDDAVWGDFPNPNWMELRDPITGTSLDMAFVITPEPTTLLLLGVAGLILLRRR